MLGESKKKLIFQFLTCLLYFEHCAYSEFAKQVKALLKGLNSEAVSDLETSQLLLTCLGQSRLQLPEQAAELLEETFTSQKVEHGFCVLIAYICLAMVEEVKNFPNAITPLRISLQNWLEKNACKDTSVSLKRSL